MWPFSRVTHPCDPCSVSICEEIKRIRANRVKSNNLTRNCRICGPNDEVLPSTCQPELIGTYTTCNEEITRFGSSDQSATNVQFQPPPGCCDKLSLKGMLWALRNEIATFQLKQGISYEQYGFTNLLKGIILTFYTIGMTVFYLMGCCLSHVLTVTTSMINFWMNIVRFILDQLLGVVMEESIKKKLILLVIFAAELFFIIIILVYMHYAIRFLTRSFLQ